MTANEKKLEVKTFTDEKTAVAALMKEIGQCSVKHSLSAEQKTTERAHQFDSWIILPRGIGRCIIAVEGCLDEPFELFNDEVTAIFVPAGSRYHLESLSSKISFSVLS